MQTNDFSETTIPETSPQENQEARASFFQGLVSEKNAHGCLIWNGTMHPDNGPVRKIKGKQIRVRAALYRLAYPSVGRVRVYNTCGNARCVAPEHSSTIRPERSIVLKVQYHIVTESGCHVRPGQKNTKKYAKISAKGKSKLAHRVAYEQKYGPIPEGKEIHHKCNNKACFNPEHLLAVEPAENKRFAQQDGLLAGPRASGAKNGNTRIGFESKLNVFDARERGISFAKIAKHFGLSASSVKKIYAELKNGSVWISRVIPANAELPMGNETSRSYEMMRLVENGPDKYIFHHSGGARGFTLTDFSIFDSWTRKILRTEESWEYKYTQGLLGEMKNVIK